MRILQEEKSGRAAEGGGEGVDLVILDDGLQVPMQSVSGVVPFDRET